MRKWFNNAWISRSTLIVAGLFFLLPFITINCSGNKMASIKGTDLVFGNELKTALEQTSALSGNQSEDMEKSSGFSLNGDLFGKDQSKHVDANPLAIMSLASVIMAFLLTFFNKRAAFISSGIFALLSVLCLFFLQIYLYREVEKELGFMNFVPISFEFTSFYWLCIIFTGIASVFSFTRSAFKPALTDIPVIAPITS